jgi:carboxyl-terminal processing protease
VQTVSTLPPGQGALKITTAMFYRPGGQSTQNDGVAADVVLPSLLEDGEYGEQNQRYALPGSRIEPFLSSYANAIPQSSRWRPITPAMLNELATRSAERVAASAEFAEIREALAKAQENAGVVHLAELIRDREETKETTEQLPSPEGNGDGVPAPADQDEKSPQLVEATDVLADLVLLSAIEPG